MTYNILRTVGLLALTAAFSTANASLLHTPGGTLGDGSGITYAFTGDVATETGDGAGDDLRFTSAAGGTFTLTFSSPVNLTIFNTEINQGVNFDANPPTVDSAVVTANAGSWGYSAGVFDLTSAAVNDAAEGVTIGDNSLSGLGTSVLTIGSSRGFFDPSSSVVAASGACLSQADWGTFSISGVTSLTYAYSDETNYDGFRMDAVAVPEPGTLGMIAAFGGGVLFIRRRFML